MSFVTRDFDGGTKEVLYHGEIYIHCASFAGTVGGLLQRKKESSKARYLWVISNILHIFIVVGLVGTVSIDAASANYNIHTSTSTPAGLPHPVLCLQLSPVDPGK